MSPGQAAAAAPQEPHGSPHTLFQVQASNYSEFRPQYAQEVYDIILQHLDAHQRELAVDVATGSGQAAIQLAQHFRQVIATDASEAQLQHAKQAPNVRYFPSDAHTIDLPNGSADLVTVASALHWLDHPRFYREVRRVLKPHGCFAAWAIPLGLATIEVPVAPKAAAACQAALHHIHEDVLGEYWDQRKRHADNLYQGIQPSLHEFKAVLMRKLDMPVSLTVDQMVGYMSSWSAYNMYRKQHPQQPDPLLEFRQQVMDALEAQGVSSTETLILAHIPTVLCLATHPKPVSQAC